MQINIEVPNPGAVDNRSGLVEQDTFARTAVVIATDIPGFDLAEPDALTAAGERILEAASELFLWHGIHAVDIDMIAEQAKMTKHTIFQQFGSQDALIATYLMRRDVAWRKRIREIISESHAENVCKRLLIAPFQELEERNAAVQVIYPGLPGYQLISDQKHWLQMFFIEVAMRFGVFSPEAEALSEKLTILYEGAITVNSMRLVEEPGATARLLAGGIIDTYLDPTLGTCHHQCSSALLLGEDGGF